MAFNPVAAWHQEHVYFSKLLRVLQKEIDAFQLGETPNYTLMLDIISYLRDYSDQFHHPREDEAFERMARRAPEADLPLERLKQEHRVIAQAGESLRRLLEEAAEDAMIPRAEVEVAAATFLVYYGNHIAIEEEDVLPRAGDLLTPEDWQAVKDAARAPEDPLFGEHPLDRFKELRRRIAMESD